MTSAPRYVNAGTSVSALIEARAIRVYAVSCYNANAASRFLQLHNSATVPNPGAVPTEVFLVPAGGQIGIGSDFFTEFGGAYPLGLAFAFSTTAATYTAGSAADQFTTIRYS